MSHQELAEMTEEKRVSIRHYKPEDFHSVRSLFYKGIHGNIWPAFKDNWNGNKPGSFCFIY
jgi:hypothetical protein